LEFLNGKELLGSATLDKIFEEQSKIMHRTFLMINASHKAAVGSLLRIEAENIDQEAKWVLARETSISRLRDCNVSHVILEQIERRTIFGESDEIADALGNARRVPIFARVGQARQKNRPGHFGASEQRQKNCELFLLVFCDLQKEKPPPPSVFRSGNARQTDRAPQRQTIERSRPLSTLTKDSLCRNSSPSLRTQSAAVVAKELF
jgi:hypothetical protein